MGVLEELALRCEAATGADRTIDMLVADAVGHAQLRGGVLYEWCEAGSTDRAITAMRYTASLDAALTLVPEGWKTHCIGESDYGPGAWMAMLTPRGMSAPHDRGVTSHGAAPALALCAAALRARTAIALNTPTKDEI